MFQQGDFTRSPGDAEKKRRAILKMMPQFGAANYTGEGLAHMLSGLLGGQRLRGLEKQEAAQRKRADGLFADMKLPPNGMMDPWFTPQQAAAIKEARKKK